jgi:SAM-dependent methyltransferase
MDPMSRLRSRIADLLDSPTMRVLDVGAGPMTSLGKRHPVLGTKVDIVACDPLADEYSEILKSLGIVPPVRTVKAFGETLVCTFGPNVFDVAHAQNSLDHADDPMEIIRQMIGVVKPGGHVILFHHQCEAEKQKYFGLHSWNFDFDNNDLVLWRSDENINVSREVEKCGASVSARLDEDFVICAEILKREHWKGGE